MMYESKVQKLGLVHFPAFTGERIYMVPFTRKNGLPSAIQRWQPTVDDMLKAVDCDPGQELYLMVDQSRVMAGQPQRRPGVHIDGYWIAGTHDWDRGQGGRWNTLRTVGEHHVPRHGGHRIGSEGGYPVFTDEEALILASDVEGSCAYAGNWSGDIGEGGDCSTVDLSNLERVRLSPFHAWAGNVTMLHESLPLSQSKNRTLVRISVPGWSP